jgi:hypothetical protein
VPASFPELQERTTAELQHLVTDEEAFDAFLCSLEALQALQKMQDQYENEASQLAKDLEAFEAERKKLQESIQKQESAAAESSAALAPLRARQQQVIQKLSGASLCRMLEEAIAACSKQSDAALAAALTASDGSIQDKLKQYLELRRLYHQRAQKRALLS